MPYKSNAQRKYFHYLEEKGKMPKKVVDEFDMASKGKDLPEHMYEGGMPMDDEDHEMGEYNWHRYNSTGEPHTNDKFDDEQDMEFMFGGGIVPGEHGSQKMPAFGEHPESHYGEVDNDADDEENYIKAGTGRAHFAHGGKVESMYGERHDNFGMKDKPRKMNKGGMANHHFAKALMKRR